MSHTITLGGKTVAPSSSESHCFLKQGSYVPNKYTIFLILFTIKGKWSLWLLRQHGLEECDEAADEYPGASWQEFVWQTCRGTTGLWEGRGAARHRTARLPCEETTAVRRTQLLFNFFFYQNFLGGCTRLPSTRFSRTFWNSSNPSQTFRSLFQVFCCWSLCCPPSLPRSLLSCLRCSSCSTNCANTNTERAGTYPISLPPTWQ